MTMPTYINDCVTSITADTAMLTYPIRLNQSGSRAMETDPSPFCLVCVYMILPKMDSMLPRRRLATDVNYTRTHTTNEQSQTVWINMYSKIDRPTLSHNELWHCLRMSWCMSLMHDAWCMTISKIAAPDMMSWACLDELAFERIIFFVKVIEDDEQIPSYAK
jgi:hypothetical protein